ncbi:MAG: CoA activase [Lachnospiraceae bacterium]|nr:CoA activase [Lachnospiraceae bacterium]MBR0434447.1 CoA activase [Lachnospiraceae bacterium]
MNMSTYIGIDIGSTCAKAVVLNNNKEIVCRIIRPTGWSSIKVAEEIIAELKEAGIHTDAARIVATGYGRVNVPYADKAVTEISCHALGATHIFGGENLLVIDIGGQDTKVIEVAEGNVSDFLMNDKCSAGTGRFLEVMANTLSMEPRDMCELARHGADTTISSLCTVFAESEVIGLIGRGESKENIAYAIIESIADKVVSQASHMTMADKRVVVTGGLCDYDYLIEAIGHKLKVDVISNEDARYAGAIGAALLAMRF